MKGQPPPASIHDEMEERVIEGRRRNGLPDDVEDPLTLALLARVLEDSCDDSDLPQAV